MKFCFFAALMLFFLASADAQRVDYNKIIASFDSLSSLDYVDKLITLAWENYPKNKTYINKIKQAKEKYYQAKNSWLNNLNLFTNFNSFNNTQVTNFSVVPNLGLGVSLNVGSLYLLPSRTRDAREEKFVAENECNAQKMFIKAEVKRLYSDYELSIQLLKFQTLASEEMRMTMQIVKKRFLNGEVSVEEYNKAYGGYIQSKQGALTSEANLRSAKASLEEYIGINLEEVK
jgi:outer membrane protein TolC